MVAGRATIGAPTRPDRAMLRHFQETSPYFGNKLKTMGKKLSTNRSI